MDASTNLPPASVITPSMSLATLGAMALHSAKSRSDPVPFMASANRCPLPHLTNPTIKKRLVVEISPIAAVDPDLGPLGGRLRLDADNRTAREAG